MLNDEHLLRAAEDAGSLTPLAQRVLRAEMALRQLTPPEPNQPPEAPELADRVVSIRRFRDLSEAIVARGALEAADIPCFLRNENTVRIDWQISNAIGGIRLDVMESDRDEAEAVLAPADAVQTAEAEAASDPACPNCGSRDVQRRQRRAIAAILTFGVSSFHGSPDWTCERCGARWSDQD